MRRTRTRTDRTALRSPASAFERLEDRRLLAGFSTSGTTLSIDLSKAAELTVTTTGAGNYLFTLDKTHADTFSGTDATGLTGNGLATLTVTSELDLTQVNITNSSGTTRVIFGESAGSYVDSFNVNLSGIAGEPLSVPSVTFLGRTPFTGAAAVTVTAPEVAVEGATLSTESGKLWLAGDTGTAFAGTYTGLTVTKGASVRSDSGPITLKGRGGNGPANQNGVAIGVGSSVSAGGTASAVAVPITIVGLGGAATGSDGSNHGILLESGSDVSAVGPLTLEGTGGPTVSGNRGVFLSGRLATTLPSSGAAAPIKITGTGGGVAGATAGGNHGVFIGNQALVMSEDAITVVGKAGPGNAIATTPYVNSVGIYLNSAHVNTDPGPIVFRGDSFQLQGSNTAIATGGSVGFENTVDGQTMFLDKPVNTVLARTYAKSIHYGTKTATIEQDVAAGGTVTINSANFAVSGKEIRLRADVTSGGGQLWDGPVVLGLPTPKSVAAGDVRLTGNGVEFADTVDGAKNLVLAAGASPLQFGKAVGKTTALASLRVESASAVKAISTVAIDGSVAGAAANGLTFATGVNGIDMQVPGSTVLNAAGHGIVLGATRESSLAGFTVKNAGAAGIRASGAMPSTKLVGIRVEGAGKSSFGAYLSDTPGLSFGTLAAGNVITGVSTGVVATGNMDLAGIRGNGLDGNTAGINLIGARGAVVAGNTLTSNSLYGIRAEGDSTGTALRNNSVTGSSLGVVLEGAKGLRVGTAGAGNVVQAGLDSKTKAYDASRTSVGLQASGDLSGTSVVANSFSDNTVGVRLTDAQGLTLRDGNQLFRNRFQAIAVSGTSTGTTIRANTIEGSLPGGGRSPFGIWISSATGLTVGGETSADANGIYGTQTAIQAEGVLTGTAVKRSIVRNMAYGTILASARNFWLQSNDINGADQQGINAHGDCSGTTVLLNQVVVGNQGVVIDAARGLAVKNNIIDSNRGTGVFATGDCTGTKVSDNAIVKNGVNLSTSTATGGWFQTS